MMENITSSEFNQFGVVSDVSDHRYVPLLYPKRRDDIGDCFTNAQSTVYKKIMKEWRILQQNLPESIFVRAYETRIELLRAAIVGAAGTPYHDALFFFDIAFPANYPNEPPRVHYRSFGYRINPNLYTNGFVCLSLLNTWTGSWSERWNPNQSTVLQVLLSIQSLVLNDDPLFNEPLTTIYRTEKMSRKYNQDVFFLTCKSTVHLIRMPPKNFEPLVYAHYRERANAILMACHAYANGLIKVGHYGDNGSGPPKVRVSRQFQMRMGWVYPELVGEFQRIGASLGNSDEHLSIEPKSQAIVESKSEGVIKKLIGKIKDILGSKKKKKKNSEKRQDLMDTGVIV